MPVSKSEELGGELEPNQLAGRRYEVTVHYSVEYRVEVLADIHDEDAVDEADLRRMAGDIEPADRNLVHSDVEVLEDIYADHPRAEQCSNWFDGPTAPSDDTFWDDREHFSEEVRAETDSEPDQNGGDHD